MLCNILQRSGNTTYFDVNEHWHQMKNIIMDTAQMTYGLSKVPCRHKETGNMVLEWGSRWSSRGKEQKVRKLEKRKKMTEAL